MTRCLPLLLLTISLLCAADGKHLFILSGQSNMAGLRPELSFTPTIEAALGKDHVIIVKDAKGGQAIRHWYKQWVSTKGEAGKNNGDLYDRLMVKVRAAIEGESIASVSFIWMQGERDAKSGEGAVYRASLEGLVAQLEEDLGTKGIRVVVGRLSDHKSGGDWELVRQAQVQACEARTHWAWVDTDAYNGSINDLHYTKDGYVELGTAFATQALALLKVKPKG